VKAEDYQDGGDVGIADDAQEPVPEAHGVFLDHGVGPQGLLAQRYVHGPAVDLFDLQVPVSVNYTSDPDVVERVLLEEAHQAASEVPGLLADPAPLVRFLPGFGGSSLNFSLLCHVREIGDQDPVLAALNLRILKWFRKEGIVPVRHPHCLPQGRQNDPMRKGIDRFPGPSGIPGEASDSCCFSLGRWVLCALIQASPNF